MLLDSTRDCKQDYRGKYHSATDINSVAYSVLDLQLFPKTVEKHELFGREIEICLRGNRACLLTVEYLKRVGVYLGHSLDIALVVDYRGERGSVVGVLRVCNRDLLLAHKVDILVCQVVVLAALRDAHRVDVGVRTLLGVVEREVLVIAVHRHKVACIVSRYRRRAARHLIEDLVHNVALNQSLLLDKQISRLAPLLLGRLVYVVAEPIESRTERVTAVVELKNVADVVFIPHKTPALKCGVLLADDGGVVDNAYHTVEVGNRVGLCAISLVIYVISLEFFVYVFVVGDLFKIKRLKHILLDHTLYHIVRGDYNVVGCRSAFDLGIHTLVAREGRIVYRDLLAGLFVVVFLKRLICVKRALRAVRDVLAPIVNVERGSFLGVAGCQREAERKKNKRDCNE